MTYSVKTGIKQNETLETDLKETTKQRTGRMWQKTTFGGLSLRRTFEVPVTQVYLS